MVCFRCSWGAVTPDFKIRCSHGRRRNYRSIWSMPNICDLTSAVSLHVRVCPKAFSLPPNCNSFFCLFPTDVVFLPQFELTVKTLFLFENCELCACTGESIVWLLLDLMTPTTTEKIDERLTPLLLQLPTLPYSTTNRQNDCIQVSDASVIAFSLLQGAFVWRKCPQVDAYHGRAADEMFYCRDIGPLASRV